MVFGGTQHDLSDAAFPHGQEHRGELGSHHGRIKDERERREQHAQPLDFLAAGPAEHRVDDGDLHRPAADRLKGHIPGRGTSQGEGRQDRAAQSLVLQI